jgi:hypothetical protein
LDGPVRRIAHTSVYRLCPEGPGTRGHLPRLQVMKTTSSRPHRLSIDLSDEIAARAWVKKLGKSKEEIAAAIERVGDNAETVKKELARLDEAADAGRNA